MTRTRDDGLSSTLGFALGTGLAFIPLIGIPARFMFQGLPPLVTYGGGFVLGVLLGVVLVTVRVGSHQK